jgi:hypothetical protein
MNECLERLNDWIDPEKKFKFVSIHRFAFYLGIRQAAVEDLVESKRINSIVVNGRTWIPLSIYYSHILGYESDPNDRPPSEVNWSSTTDNLKK